LYSFHFFSQWKIALPNIRIFNRMQPVHSPMTEFGAVPQLGFCESRTSSVVPHFVLMGIDARSSRDHGLRFVKIAHFPRPARYLQADDVGTVTSAVRRAQLDAIPQRHAWLRGQNYAVLSLLSFAPPRLLPFPPQSTTQAVGSE
jgi:hypothetical protein